MVRSIPVVDVFAGPGGLGEGFQQFRAPDDTTPFRIALSIEKDLFAYHTLRMRSFFRQFPSGDVPQEYYAAVQTESPDWALLEQEFRHQMARVDEEVLHAELGRVAPAELDTWINGAICGTDKWVLIGGPPCQAYSVAGRARLTKSKWHYARDPRHTLYREYLGILAVHHPAVFVMENVKGILSSKRSGRLIVDRILSDLQTPCGSVGRCRQNVRYRIYAIANYDGSSMSLFLEEPGSYMVQAENHGIPQARHRFIVVGVREDIDCVPELLSQEKPVPMWEVIRDLAPLRSRLSKNDSPEFWAQEIRRMASIIVAANGFVPSELRALLLKAVTAVRKNLTSGGHFVDTPADPKWMREWFFDHNLAGTLNHCSRSHIATDLWRYLYASVFAQLHDRSPKLREFPKVLWPAHENLKGLSGKDDLAFDDRFRVQVKSQPASTVTAHISKDGHYFIHPDPRQCRTLTVREAARLQTFPDNYAFLGPRTAQYQQVGNAVPPLLAVQIARIVHNVLFKDAGQRQSTEALLKSQPRAS